MKTNNRFIKTALNTSAKDMPAMPWKRGSRRAAFITKRSSQPVLRKTA